MLAAPRVHARANIDDERERTALRRRIARQDVRKQLVDLLEGERATDPEAGIVRVRPCVD